LVQSDDPRVGRLALVPRRIDAEPWGLARELELLVNRSIRKKNFSQAFASAAEVARSLEGDCTEHSVLLAAVCRARKIPARSAIGLVYYPPKRGFAYHMWNEVWIGDRWLPLDATIGRGYVAADRLKLVDTNLDGANAYSAMLPVVQVFGRLELEIKEVEEME
jgi:transglutaminase-like putative cysteine protease